MPAPPDSPWRRQALCWALLGLCAALPVSIAGFNAAAAAVTVLLLWSDFAGDRPPWNQALTRFSAALAVYCAAAAIVSAASVAPALSFHRLHKDLHKAWLLWLLLVALDFARPRLEIAFIAAGCLIIAVVGICQTAFLTMSHNTMWVRAHAFTHPVTYGEIMALCWLGALCAWLRPDASMVEARFKKLTAAFLLTCGAALLLNQTRGVLLGLMAALVALGWSDARLRRLVALPLVAAPIVLLLWELFPNNHTFSEMIARMGGPDPNPFLARLTFWRVGWQMFLDHPWFGVGPGNYRSLFDLYFKGVFDGESVWGSAHNLYIHQTAERGLLGLSALAAVLWTMTARSWQRLRQAPQASNLWAFASCVAFLVMNLTEVAFQNEQVMSLMIFIWAFAEARHKQGATSP